MSVRVRMYRRDVESLPREVASQFTLERGGLMEADHDVMFKDMDSSEVPNFTARIKCYRIKDQIMEDSRTIRATVHDLPLVFS